MLNHPLFWQPVLKLQSAAGWLQLPRPDPDHARRSWQVLKATFLRRDLYADEEASFSPARAAKAATERRDLAAQLITLASGDWRQPELVHHCRLGCCGSPRESKAKLWAAVQSAFFASGPTVPALSRRTSCTAAMRFYLPGALTDADAALS